MHSSLGKTIAYVGRTIFGAIIFILLVGVIKFHGDIGGYISFLNARDRTSMGSLSQTFWGTTGQQMPQIQDDTTWTSSSIDILANTGGTTGLDAYDPSLESDMNATTSSWFGFSAPSPDQQAQEQTTQQTSPQPQSDKQQIMNLIKNRELQTKPTP